MRPSGSVSTPQHIVVDSRDNVFVTLKYGMLKIAPDGTVTDLSKQGPVIGGMDRSWSNLIIDSKDNLYANDGKVIYRITVTEDNKATMALHKKSEIPPTVVGGIPSTSVDGSFNCGLFSG